jgi:hypothetical protein
MVGKRPMQSGEMRWAELKTSSPEATILARSCKGLAG